MKSQNTLLKLSKAKIYSSLFVVAFIAGSSAAFAQVKIGTNPTTIEPNSNLEVEASTPQRKMKVDKTTGQVSIADGTQGVGKVFTSDANGGGSWQATQLVKANVVYTNDGQVTVPPGLSGTPGNVQITFPENGTYAISFAFIGDTQNKVPFPVADSWFGVSLSTAGVGYLNHQDNLIPASTFMFISGMRYITITNAPVTLGVSYINASSVPITLRGNSTRNYNEWFAYKVF